MSTEIITMCSLTTELGSPWNPRVLPDYGTRVVNGNPHVLHGGWSPFNFQRHHSVLIVRPNTSENRRTNCSSSPGS